MDRGFFIILGAQFFSALADNALFIAAISLLRQQSAPEWYNSVLLCCFTVFYVVLAPFVGSLADAMHKGRAMMLCNGIKLAGCLGMLLGVPVLLCYAIVGFGAAAYSPAKYGIITEYLPHERLVAANGWLEGTTVAAIVFGTVLGGVLIAVPTVTYIHTVLPEGVRYTPAQIAIFLIGMVYLVAAWLNLYIPKLNVTLKPLTIRPVQLGREFYGCLRRLWRDPGGQLSLAVTTYFWGIGATMRLVIINWAMLWLHFNLEKSTKLVAVVAFGTALGAALAGKLVPLQKAFRVLPAGILIGFLVMSMLLVYEVWLAAILMFIVGVLAGYLVVPMNAILQHRGYCLMGAGHSIAVQNFNENLGILLMVGAHALIVKHWSQPVPADASYEVMAQFAHTGGVPPMFLIITVASVSMIMMMLYAMWRCYRLRVPCSNYEEKIYKGSNSFLEK